MIRNKLLSLERFARLLKIPSSYLQTEIKAGRLPAIEVEPDLFLVAPQVIINILHNRACNLSGIELPPEVML